MSVPAVKVDTIESAPATYPPAWLAQWVMANSKPAGEVCGFKFAICDKIPPGLMLVASPENPELAQWWKIKS